MTIRVRRLGLLALSLSLLGLPGSAQGAPLSERSDADRTEAYFSSSDGITTLHADILRPKDLDPATKTPVILTVSPYTSHNGGTTDTDMFGTGASPRFFDFLDLSGALDRGYTYVMVDLPGFGGSGGCNDWGGVREQGAVRAAVEWAAAQPWSTGKVALLGKSYDGWTGLMGVAQQPIGLAAVVSMEPVFAGYRYIYMNGVRRTNQLGTIAGFQAYDSKPGRPSDDPQYLVTSAPQGYCYATNIGGSTLDDSPSGIYWGERDLVHTSRGKTTPVFLTQGFLETNTKPDGAFEYWNDLSGTKNRAWFGQFDHVRGWEDTGRNSFIAEVMRFLDEHLLGIPRSSGDPVVAVQDSLGRYRAESQWPPADARPLETQLRIGTYRDSGNDSGLVPRTSLGIWTASEPLAHDVWLSGEPYLTVGARSAPNANLAANVYDIDPHGYALMISRGVSLLRGVGAKSASYSMYGQDWLIPAGHRIGVKITNSDIDEFTHVPTQQAVEITSAKISLPFLTYDRTRFIDGEPTARLESYMTRARWLDPDFLASVEAPFTLPGPLAG